MRPTSNASANGLVVPPAAIVRWLSTLTDAAFIVYAIVVVPPVVNDVGPANATVPVVSLSESVTGAKYVPGISS